MATDLGSIVPTTPGDVRRMTRRINEQLLSNVAVYDRAPSKPLLSAYKPMRLTTANAAEIADVVDPVTGVTNRSLIATWRHNNMRGPTFFNP